MNNYFKIPDEYARTIVVGDIHGCFKELERLLGIVGFDNGDVLISVGDMVDRGPQSWEVCRFFRDTLNACSVLGNHERRVAETIRGTSQPAWSQKHSISMLDQDERISWTEYFENLPAVIETQHAIITHARLDPAKPLDEQDPYFTCAVGGNKIQIDLDETGTPFWFNEADFEKPVCMGHIGYKRVELVPGKLFALDTRVVKGGKLTCVVFPGCEVFSVQAERDYYTESLTGWQEKEILALGDINQWPLEKVTKLLKDDNQHDDPVMTVAASKAQDVIDNLRIENWAHDISEQLLKRFGEIPGPGPGRGEYFIRVKKSFPDLKLGSLAAKVIAGRAHCLEAFIPIVKKGSLSQVKEIMETLVKATDNS